MNNRKNDWINLLSAIEFYTNDCETQGRDWFTVLTEALEFLHDNFQEVSHLRRGCWVMINGKPVPRECYQQDLDENHMKVLMEIEKEIHK